MTAALLLAALMVVQYAVTAVNMRMVARGRYLGTALTDAILAAFGFTLIQQVGAAETPLAQAGYVAGGVVGGMLGIWLSPERKKIEEKS